MIKLVYLDSHPQFGIGVIFLKSFWNLTSLSSLERWATCPLIAMCMVTLSISISPQPLDVLIGSQGKGAKLSAKCLEMLIEMGYMYL